MTLRRTGKTQRSSLHLWWCQPNGGGGENHPGKRSDPDFEQVTAYIRRHTHQGVKIALLQEGKGQEFSELVEDLLAKWLKARS